MPKLDLLSNKVIEEDSIKCYNLQYLFSCIEKVKKAYIAHWNNTLNILQEVFCKKGFLRNFAKFTVKRLCQSLFFNKVAGLACNFIKKETLAEVFAREFYGISKSNFFLQNTSSGCFWCSHRRGVFRNDSTI